ncbi:hypothetical protein V6N11_066951 [Hibiscus sabdariffa]|uniref:Longin domain-containing protein n=1 Tax=Hibiscus sabdariffa TaxID=183260 RepID=A0ABR2SPN7_9ROSI
MKITSLLVLKCHTEGSDPIILANASDVSHFGYFQRSSIREFIVFVSRTVAKRTPPGQRQSVQHEGYFLFLAIRSMAPSLDLLYYIVFFLKFELHDQQRFLIPSNYRKGKREKKRGIRERDIFIDDYDHFHKYFFIDSITVELASLQLFHSWLRPQLILVSHHTCKLSYRLSLIFRLNPRLNQIVCFRWNNYIGKLYS